MTGLVERGVKVVLVPHVLAPRGRPESDLDAASALVDALPGAVRAQVTCSSPRTTRPR